MNIKLTCLSEAKKLIDILNENTLSPESGWTAYQILLHCSACFLEDMFKAFPFPVQCFQTDSGLQFTNRFAYRTPDCSCPFEKN